MSERSPLEIALEQVGDRWTLQVVDALLEGALRFSDLKERVTGIAPNILTGRLRALEAQGVINARAYSQKPPRSMYELTAQGRELAGAIRLLSQWAVAHESEAEPVVHETCGTPMHVAWYCPTCSATVEGEPTELKYV